jgi:PPP family 3-phenylpropionic acid transporter
MPQPADAISKRSSEPWSSDHFRRPLDVARMLYLFFFMALGSYLPFINLYYDRLGLTGTQIGTLAALPVMITSLTALLWGGIADIKHWHRPILRLALFFSPVAIFLLSQVSIMALLVPVVIAYAFFSSPIVPLLDSYALEAATKAQRSYGDFRLWGSIGWAISTILIGWLIEKLGIHWLFYGYISLMGVTLVISFFQPRREIVLRSTIWEGLKDLLANRSFILVLLSLFLLLATSSGISTFFSIYLDAIGTTEGLIGLGWAIAALSEVPVMLLSGKIMRKIGSAGLLIIAFTTFAVRWLLFSFIHTPMLALAVQLLHGLAFGAYLVGSISYISKRTPAGLNTTALSILSMVTSGFGAMTGSFVAGVLFDQVGMDNLFRISSIVVLFSLLVFLLSQRLPTKRLQT